MAEDSRYVFEEEVVRLAKRLKELDPASDEYHKVSERLLKLHEADMNELKADREFQKRSEDQTLKESELDFKKKEAKTAKIRDYLRIGVDLGIGLATLGAYGKWFHDGLNWEVDHTPTTNWLRNLISKMTPKI